jgi:hypothetical protein
MARRGGAAAPAPSISYTGSPFTWYDYFTSVNLAVSNVGGPVTSYAVQAGTLPTGVSLNTSTGAITGTPTALKTAANVTIRATGPGGTSDAIINIAVAWFPSSISGLVAGYDTEAGFSSLKTASDGSGSEAADTDAVGYMSDLSGNANHVIQATTGNKPTLAAAGLNSKRCITFDGADSLAITAFAGGAETQPNTIVIVFLHGANNAAYQVMMTGGAAGGLNGVYQNNSTNWGMYAINLIDSGDAADTALHLHAAVLNGASSKQYIDGTEIVAADAGSQSMDGVTLGSSEGGGSNLVPAGSKCAAAIVFAGDKTADLANLKTWAVAKWGTPA